MKKISLRLTIYPLSNFHIGDTITQVDLSGRGGVERYLTDMLKPLVGEDFPVLIPLRLIRLGIRVVMDRMLASGPAPIIWII